MRACVALCDKLLKTLAVSAYKESQSRSSWQRDETISYFQLWLNSALLSLTLGNITNTRLNFNGVPNWFGSY